MHLSIPVGYQIYNLYVLSTSTETKHNMRIEKLDLFFI